MSTIITTEVSEMNYHIMIDIETLGLAADSVVTQIAAVHFTMHPSTFTILHDYNVFIDVTDSLKQGQIIEAETLKWWIQSNKSKFEIFLDPKNKCPPETALSGLKHWMDDRKYDYVWSCGPLFDIGHLENMEQRYKVEMPWRYSQIRDYRTIRDTVGADYSALPLINQDPHDALADAQYQAQHLHHIFKRIA